MTERIEVSFKDPIVHSIEITGEWFGIPVPSWLRAFDCRSSDEQTFKSKYWGSERAQIDLGLGVGWECHATTPLSCSTYYDARGAAIDDLRHQVEDMVREADKFYAEWETATDNPGNGGSCLYRPVGIALCNYGWSVISDKRTMKVRAFR
jgi:hypothetical protein